MVSVVISHYYIIQYHVYTFAFAFVDLLAVRALAVHFEADFVILNPNGTVNVLPADPNILFPTEIGLTSLYQSFGQNETSDFFDYFMQAHEKMPVVLLYSGGPGSYHYDLAMPLPVLCSNIISVLCTIMFSFRWLLLLMVHSDRCPCRQWFHRVWKQFFAAANRQFFLSLNLLLHLNQQILAASHFQQIHLYKTYPPRNISLAPHACTLKHQLQLGKEILVQERYIILQKFCFNQYHIE